MRLLAHAPSVVYVAKEDGVVDAWDLLTARTSPRRARVNSGAAGPWKRSPAGEKPGEKTREQLLAGATTAACCTSCARRAAQARAARARAHGGVPAEMARAEDAARRAEAREAAAAAREGGGGGGGGREENPKARAKGERGATEDERREAEYLALEECSR